MRFTYNRLGVNVYEIFMAARVISFRVDDDVQTELEKRKLQDESIMLTAQRILREALGLGVIGEQARRVEEIVDTAVQPIQQEIEELRAKLGEVERWVNNLNDCASQDVPSLKNDVWLLKQFVFDCSDPLSARVKKLEERLEVSEVKVTAGEVDPTAPDTPQIECSHCGAVGFLHKGFKPAGSSKGLKRYQCSKCTKKFVQRPAPDIPQN
jgi:hypothetical protein